MESIRLIKPILLVNLLAFAAMIAMPSCEKIATETHDTAEDEECESDDEAHVCKSEDGRITIRSGIEPFGGTSPDYWSEWTIKDEKGESHTFFSGYSSYQDRVHRIAKADGDEYYIVNCSGKASSSDGYEWLQAFKIVGDTVQEVNVMDGSEIGEDRDMESANTFEVNYVIPDWYFATYGAGYDWILEYDEHSQDLYVPITTDYCEIIDRYQVWHFDGTRFVHKADNYPNKHLHESLGQYEKLLLYCTTNDYIVRVDCLSGSQLRYASWKKPKTTADETDVVIYGGVEYYPEEDKNGYRPCRDFRFKNSGYEYIVNYCEIKEEDDGSALHYDYLLVRRNGKVLTKQEILK